MANNSSSSSQILLRFKIRESERTCTVDKHDLISRVKVMQFPGENVRFIYQGREIGDNVTVCQAELPDQCVVHVVIRANNVPSRRNTTPIFNEADLDPCMILAMLVGLIISIAIILALSLPDLFNTQSWLLLSFCSFGGLSFITYVVKSRINVARRRD